jgi:hypothetical protein
MASIKNERRSWGGGQTNLSDRRTNASVREKDVREVVEREFSQMEQAHARIREAQLSVRLREGSAEIVVKK